MKGLDQSIVKRSQFPRHFDRFWKYSLRAGQMYQDWARALWDLSGVDLKQASVFEIGCNTGYLLFSLKEQGAGHCVGIDQADLDRQHSILKQVTGIHDIEFRKGRWCSETHSIDGLGQEEQFDLVICTAFAQHTSDPLHLIRELSRRTRRAMLLHTSVGYLNTGMTIRYRSMEHHETWGGQFPNNLDTRVSRKLLMWSLRQCGFKEIVQLEYSRKWLPRLWYNQFSTLVCLK